MTRSGDGEALIASSNISQVLTKWTVIDLEGVTTLPHGSLASVRKRT
jgi:hypothetical protein